MIIITRFIPAKFDALTVWPLILIRPGKDKPSLIAHELTHYRAQAWITPWWLIRYWLSPAFRLRAEVRGYRAQIAGGDISVDGAAQMLTRYELGMTHAQALAALQ